MENGQSFFFSLASHALRACEALTLRARKTLTPRFTDMISLPILTKKTTVLQSTKRWNQRGTNVAILSEAF